LNTGHIKNEYRAFVRRLEATEAALPEPRDSHAWAGWKEILEILLTPEEADLAARLPLGASGLDAIAARVGAPAETLKPRLDALCDRGIVVDIVRPGTGETLYLLAPPMAGFLELSMMRKDDLISKKRMAEALDSHAWLRCVHASDLRRRNSNRALAGPRNRARRRLACTQGHGSATAARIGRAMVEAARRANLPISRDDRRKFLGRCAMKDHAICAEIELSEDLSRALLRCAGC
jgi:hypothetical protein